MTKLYYFQAPSLDINPDSETAPRLGSIFSRLDILTEPLNRYDYVSVPENLQNRSTCSEFSKTVGWSFGAGVDLDADLMQGRSGSADLIYAFARDKKKFYSCDQLETVEFTPTPEFVTECIITSQRVQSFLENSIMGRKRVYMVTGLKIATGFAKSITKETQHSPRLKIAANTTSTIGIPVETGLELGLDVNIGQTVGHGRTVNKIVLAYRVIRIKLRRDGVAQWKYKSGGKYAMNEDSGEDEDEEDKWELEPLFDHERLNDFPDSVSVKVKVMVGPELGPVETNWLTRSFSVISGPR